jgi:hypothetical protein
MSDRKAARLVLEKWTNGAYQGHVNEDLVENVEEPERARVQADHKIKDDSKNSGRNKRKRDLCNTNRNVMRQRCIRIARNLPVERQSSSYCNRNNILDR